MGQVNIDLHLLVSVCGYLGAVLMLGGFAATATGRLSPSSRRYHAANLLGGAALLVSCVAQAAWPSAGVNVVWMAISVLTLMHAAQVRSRPPGTPLAAANPVEAPLRVLQSVS